MEFLYKTAMRTAVAYLRKEVAVALVNKWDRLSQYRRDFLSDLPPMKKAWSYKGTCHVVVGLKGGVGTYTAD
ncbi:hypothetical protein AA0118_g9736 [Alternaria tenuissima]|nr:hypothetical protein AA0118_g9736 [Alternaria tenuissima]